MWGKVFQERVKKNLQLFCFQKLAFLGVKIPKIPAHLFVTGSDAPYSPTTEAASATGHVVFKLGRRMQIHLFKFIKLHQLKKPKTIGQFYFQSKHQSFIVRSDAQSSECFWTDDMNEVWDDI